MFRGLFCVFPILLLLYRDSKMIKMSILNLENYKLFKFYRTKGFSLLRKGDREVSVLHWHVYESVDFA